MDKKPFLSSVVFKREFLSVFVVVVNAFSWYFPLYALFTDVVNKLQMAYPVTLAAFGLHYMAVIVSAIIGIAIVNKIVSRTTLLSLWMFLGIVATGFMVTLEGGNLTYLLSAAIFLGVSLGLGFPSCLAYFADYGAAEHRGRLGGFTYCVAGLGIFSMGLVTIVFTPPLSIAILAIWRGIGLIAFVLTKPRQNAPKKEVDVSFGTILSERSFMLYLVPWIMFSLINYLERPIHRTFFGADLFNLQEIVEFGIGSVVALASGFLSDMVGRKRIVIMGYVILGIGYAVLGLFPNLAISRYFYIAIDGVAWGILASMFFIIIWGELAGSRGKDKYYFLGALPFLLSSFIEILVSPYVELISVLTSFSLASFFLFLAVLPLMYAPETLPERKIEIRRLRGYVEHAKKTKDKYAAKSSVEEN